MIGHQKTVSTVSSVLGAGPGVAKHREALERYIRDSNPSNGT